MSNRWTVPSLSSTIGNVKSRFSFELKLQKPTPWTPLSNENAALTVSSASYSFPWLEEKPTADSMEPNKYWKKINHVRAEVNKISAAGNGWINSSLFGPFSIFFRGFLAKPEDHTTDGPDLPFVEERLELQEAR